MAEMGGVSGFALIEMVVVILVIGILSAVALPQYARIMERPRAAEGVQFLLAIKGAQDRYFNRYGVYCIGALTAANCRGWDITIPAPKYFDAVPNTVAAGTWNLTLTRTFNTIYYGQYTLIYTDGGNPALTCTPAPDCTNELLPAIR